MERAPTGVNDHSVLLQLFDTLDVLLLGTPLGALASLLVKLSLSNPKKISS